MSGMARRTRQAGQAAPDRAPAREHIGALAAYGEPRWIGAFRELVRTGRVRTGRA